MNKHSNSDVTCAHFEYNVTVWTIVCLPSYRFHSIAIATCFSYVRLLARVYYKAQFPFRTVVMDIL